MSRLLTSLANAGECIDRAVDALHGVSYLTPDGAAHRYERAVAMVDQAYAMLTAAGEELARALGANPAARAALVDQVLSERYPGRHTAGGVAAAGPGRLLPEQRRDVGRASVEGEPLRQAARDGWL